MIGVQGLIEQHFAVLSDEGAASQGAAIGELAGDDERAGGFGDDEAAETVSLRAVDAVGVGDLKVVLRLVAGGFDDGCHGAPAIAPGGDGGGIDAAGIAQDSRGGVGRGIEVDIDEQAGAGERDGKRGSVRGGGAGDDLATHEGLLGDAFEDAASDGAIRRGRHLKACAEIGISGEVRGAAALDIAVEGADHACGQRINVKGEGERGGGGAGEVLRLHCERVIALRGGHAAYDARGLIEREPSRYGACDGIGDRCAGGWNGEAETLADDGVKRAGQRSDDRQHNPGLGYSVRGATDDDGSTAQRERGVWQQGDIDGGVAGAFGLREAGPGQRLAHGPAAGSGDVDAIRDARRRQRHDGCGAQGAGSSADGDRRGGGAGETVAERVTKGGAAAEGGARGEHKLIGDDGDSARSRGRDGGLGGDRQVVVVIVGVVGKDVDGGDGSRLDNGGVSMANRGVIEGDEGLVDAAGVAKITGGTGAVVIGCMRQQIRQCSADIATRGGRSRCAGSGIGVGGGEAVVEEHLTQ